MNILFTCVGRRHYLVDYFQRAKPSGSLIIGADMQSTAPAMAIVDKPCIVPAVYDPHYVEILADICRKEDVGAIISLNDLELPVLSAHDALFREAGVRLLVSSPAVTDICFDKWKTVEFATQLGIKTPKTYLDLGSASEAIVKGELKFPVVVKPRWGSASIGIEFPADMQELEMTYALLQKKLFRSMLAEISRTDALQAILIQEKVGGTEYGLDVFNDLDGRNLAVYVKEKLAMRAGETDKARLCNHPAMESLGKTIGENLGHIANLDCDVFEYEGNFYLIEMNPRFGGGYPFSQMSGANFPAAIYAMLNNESLNTDWFSKNFDQIFSKCDILIPVS